MKYWIYSAYKNYKYSDMMVYEPLETPRINWLDWKNRGPYADKKKLICYTEKTLIPSNILNTLDVFYVDKVGDLNE